MRLWSSRQSGRWVGNQAGRQTGCGNIYQFKFNIWEFCVDLTLCRCTITLKFCESALCCICMCVATQTLQGFCNASITLGRYCILMVRWIFLWSNSVPLFHVYMGVILQNQISAATYSICNKQQVPTKNMIHYFEIRHHNFDNSRF